MSQTYVGEIRMFGGNFAPLGWMFCEGQLLPISEFETLFNLIGTTYGGDGQSTFALPDLRGRVPLHQGAGFTLAQSGGVESVTLTTSQIPAHQHAVLASSNVGGASSPANGVFAQVPAGTVQVYTQDNEVKTTATPVSQVGGSQPHDNHQPLLVVDFIISLFGIFPSQT
jgi:microcystin-dependent protein